MTKRLTALGFAAVAVVWGPYVYAELARKPLPPATVEPPSPIIEPTPAAYVSPATERTQLLAALAEAREKAAAQAHDEPAVNPDAPELPGGAQPSAAPTTTVSVATEPPAAAPEVPQVAAPQPAAADPAAHPQPAAAPAAEPPSADAHAAKDEGPHAAPAKEEPSDDRHEEAKDAREEPKRAPADEATPESLAPAFRSTFDRESRDVAWANGEEPRLTKLLEGAGVPESAISEVRCQSTVCRIALNSVDLKAVQQSPLYQLISSRVKDEFGTLGLDAAGEGEQHAAFYVLRKGYELEHARDTN